MAARRLSIRLLPFLTLAAVAAAPLELQKVLGMGNDMSAVDGRQVRDKLLKAEIIPQVVDDFTPAFILGAQWSSKTQAKLGNTLKPDHLGDQPTVTLTPTITTKAASLAGAVEACPTILTGNATSNVSYAIALTDPDAPSREDPKWGEFCHWVATGRVVVTPRPPHPFESGNMARDEEWEQRIGSGAACSSLPPTFELAGLKDVVPYKPPAPPKGTGRHRYVFLVFTPVNATTAPLNVTRPGDRKHWGYGKEGRGAREWAEENGLVPVAANFIYAQNKDH